MWRETTKHERNLRIWREELDEFVPARVLDCHVHIFNEASLPAGATVSAGGHPITRYEFSDLAQDLTEALPGRETSAVCFGYPNATHDLHANNRFVAAGCDGSRFFGLRLLHPVEDPDDVRDEIMRDGFRGLKPYPCYAPSGDINVVQIDRMLPAGIMRVADDLGLIITLHIPRKGRLADPLNQEQIVRLCTTYPRAKIVLAHIGRAYYLRNIEGHLDRLTHLPNLYVDLAMVMNADVLDYAFRVMPPERILFGTDIPIALAPGHSVEINHQYTYVTPVPWELSIHDPHGKLVFTSFLYEQLRAIKKAVRRAGKDRRFVEAVFHDNGTRLLNER